MRRTGEVDCPSSTRKTHVHLWAPSISSFAQHQHTPVAHACTRAHTHALVMLKNVHSTRRTLLNTWDGRNENSSMKKNAFNSTIWCASQANAAG